MIWPIARIVYEWRRFMGQEVGERETRVLRTYDIPDDTPRHN